MIPRLIIKILGEEDYTFVIYERDSKVFNMAIITVRELKLELAIAASTYTLITDIFKS